MKVEFKRVVVQYIISFLMGVCSLQFFADITRFKMSSLTLLALLIFSFLLTKIALGFQKKWESVGSQDTERLLKRVKYHRYIKYLKPLVKHLKWIVLAFVLGYMWMWLHVYLNLAKRLPENLEGEAIQVVGTIVSLPETQSSGTRFEFEINRTIPKELWPNPGKVILSYYDLKQFARRGESVVKESRELSIVKVKREIFKVGDEWQFWVKLKKPRGYSNPGSFDKEKYYFQNRLQAQGRVLLKLPARKRGRNNSSLNSEVTADNPHCKTQTIANYLAKNNHNIAHGNNIDCSPKKITSHWYSSPIHRLRHFLVQKINTVLVNKMFCPLITALVLGIREGITLEQWNVFRDTGTAHLMAISGLHVGLVASVIYMMIQFVWRCLPQTLLIIPATWVAALGSIIGALIYAVLAGFSIPTQRALVMITLFMFCMLTRRIGNPVRTYFIALGLVLLWDPFSTLSIGFWLSFAAVGMMLYGLKGRLFPKGLWWKWGRAQWVVFLGLMPLTLASFNQLSLVSPIANFLAIPWVSFTVVPTALLGTVMLLVSDSIGSFFLTWAETCFSMLWPLLNFFAKMPKATWMPAAVSTPALIAAFFGTVLLLVPRGFPGRFLGLIALLPLFMSKPMLPEIGTANFTLLDVGQGLAAVLQTNKHVLVFDTGPKFGAESDTGSRVILPFLESKGIKKIDAIVISHGDNDHVGGLGSLLKKMPVGTILTSEIAAVEKIAIQSQLLSRTLFQTESKFQPHLQSDSRIGTNIKPCYAGQKWHWDGIEFEMIHPETAHTAKRNDHCCVLQVKVGKQSVLLTGDIELDSEKKLLEKNSKKLASTLLVVPHHGSKTSSSQEFIQAVHPAYALIPVGYLNPYGHPKAEIIERYRQLNIPLLDSIKDGAISFVLKDQEKIDKPECFRANYKHYWQWGL